MDGMAVRLHREHPIEAQLVRDLYQHAGWWPDRREEDIRTVLEAAPAVGAWSGSRFIGFARVVTDGVFHAYVEDVAVHEEYRGCGAGTARVTALLNEIGGTHHVSLFCKTGLVPFYGEQGFQPTNQVVMHRANPRPNDGES